MSLCESTPITIIFYSFPLFLCPWQRGSEVRKNALRHNKCTCFYQATTQGRFQRGGHS